MQKWACNKHIYYNSMLVNGNSIRASLVGKFVETVQIIISPRLQTRYSLASFFHHSFCFGVAMMLKVSKKKKSKAAVFNL